MENISTAVVVGAGVSGLQTARALLKRGLQVLVLEQRSEVGGVWTRDYPGFGLQVPCEFYQFAEFPWPADIERDPAHPSNAAVHAYVRAYAAHFGLLQHIRFGCQLLRLQAAPGGGWAVIYLERASGLFQVVPADFVVVATGMYSVANVPVYKGMQLFRGTQLHAKDFKDASIATGKRVVVVGAGRSALDCATMVAASRNAASVTWLFRQPHWPVPSRLASWLAMPHLIHSRLPAQLLPPYYTASAAQLSMHKLAAPGKRATWDWLQRRIARQFALEGSLVPAMSLDADLLYSGQVVDAQWNTILLEGMRQQQQLQLQAGRGREGKRKKSKEAGRRTRSADAAAGAAAQSQQQQQQQQDHCPLPAAAAGGGSSRAARRSSFSFGACWRPGSSDSEGGAGCGLQQRQQQQQQALPGASGGPDAMPSLANGPAGGGLVLPLCGEIERFAPDYLLLRNGGAVAADVVLYCTGYSKSYDYLDAGPRAKLGIAKDGLPLFRNILPPLLPRLGFIGAEASSYNNVLTSGLQAEWLGDVLSGRLVLPGLAAMQDDVRRLTAWRRRVFPPHRNRAAAVQLYMQQYHEQLLVDRGLPAPRPAWLLQPLTAAHYASAFAPPPGLAALDGSGASESDAGVESVSAAAEAARVACDRFSATGLASAAAVAAALQQPDSGRQAPAAPEAEPSSADDAEAALLPNAADEAADEEAAGAVADRRRWGSLLAPIAGAVRRNSASSCGTGSSGAAAADAAAAAAALPALCAGASSGAGDGSSCQAAADYPVEQWKLPAIAALQQQDAAEECGNSSSPSSSSIATSMFARPGSLSGALLDASPSKPGRAAAAAGGMPAGSGAVPAAGKAAGEDCNQGLAAASKVAIQQPALVVCAAAAAAAAGLAGEATAAAGAVAVNKAAAGPLSPESSGGSPLLAADGSACAIAGDSINSSLAVLQQPPGNSSSDGGGPRYQQQAAAGGAPVVSPPATPLALSVVAGRVSGAAKAGARSSKCSYTTCEQLDCCSSKLSALPAVGAVRQLPPQPPASPSDLRADVLATIEGAGGYGAVRQQQAVQQWLDATPEDTQGPVGHSRHGSSSSSSNGSYGYNRLCEQVSVGAGASSCAAALADGRPCAHMQQQRDLQQAAAGTYHLLPGGLGEPAVNPRRLSNGGSAAAAAAAGAAEHAACSASSQQQLLDDASVAAWQQLRQQQQMLQQQLVQQQMLLDQQQQQLDLQARLQQQQQARLGCGGGRNAAASARRNSCPWPAAQAAAACGAGVAGVEFAAGEAVLQRCASARGYDSSSSCNGEALAGDALPAAGRARREFRVAPLQLPAAAAVAAASAAAAGLAGQASVRSRAVSSPGVDSAAAPTAASAPWLHASDGASARPSADVSEPELEHQGRCRRPHGSSCSATGSSAAASAAAMPACAGDAAANDAAMLIAGTGSSESLPRKDAAAAATTASGSGSTASSGWRKGLRRTASSSAAGLGGSSSSVCPVGNCEGSTSSIGRRGHSNLRKSSTASATEILDLLSEHGICPERTGAAEEAAAAAVSATAADRAEVSAFAAAMMEPSEVLAAAATAELPAQGFSSSSSGAAAAGKASGSGSGLLRLLVRGFSLSGSSSKPAHSGSNGVTDTSSLAGSSSIAAPASSSACTHPHPRRSLSSSCNGGSLLSGAPPLPPPAQLPAAAAAAAAATAPCSSNVAGSGTVQSPSECGYHHQQQRLLQQRSLSSLRHIMARMQAASDALEQQQQQASLIAHLTSTQQAALKKASAAAAAASGGSAPASTRGSPSCCNSACAAYVLQASLAPSAPHDPAARRHSSLSAACQSTRNLPGDAACSLARAASSPAHVTGGVAGSTSSILAGMQPCGSLQDVLEGVPFAAQGDDAAAAARLPMSGPPRRRSRQLSNGSGVSAAAAAAAVSAANGSRPSTAAADGAAGAGPVATGSVRCLSMPLSPVQHAWQDERWQQWLHQQHQLVMVPDEQQLQQQQLLLPVEQPQASDAGSARSTAQLREHISRRGSAPAVQQAAPAAANGLVLNRLGSRAAALRQLRVLRQQPEAVGVLLSSLRAWQASPEAAAAGHLAAKAVAQPEPAA